MKPSQIKYRQMAKTTRRAAKAYYERMMRQWGPGSDDYDASMVRMFKSDLKILRKFAVLVNQGSISRAGDLIDRMDTAVYEVIPNRTYDYIYRAYQ